VAAPAVVGAELTLLSVADDEPCPLLMRCAATIHRLFPNSPPFSLVPELPFGNALEQQIP